MTATTLRATVADGKIVLDAPAGWPDGTALVVDLRLDDDVPESPEQIAARVERLRSLGPSGWTDEDEARWQQGRAAQKAFELATWEAEAEKARRRVDG